MERDLSERIKQLKSKPYIKDKQFSVAEESQVQSFEQRYNIRLPEAYRRFILEIANGIGGVMGEIIPLGKEFGFSGDREEQIRYLNQMHKEFPFEKPWLFSCDISEDEELLKYTYPSSMSDLMKNGSMIIENDGCSMYWNLIITGPQRGKIWLVGGGCINPCIPSMDFIDWFELIHEGKDPYPKEGVLENIEQMREELEANKKNPEYNEILNYEKEVVYFIVDSVEIYEKVEHFIFRNDMYFKREHRNKILGLIKCRDGRVIGKMDQFMHAISICLYKKEAIKKMIETGIIARSEMIFISDLLPEGLKTVREEKFLINDIDDMDIRGFKESLEMSEKKT